MSRQLDELTKRFWSAAWFIRRAPIRDKAIAVRILRQLHASSSGAISERAGEILKGIENGANSRSTTE